MSWVGLHRKLGRYSSGSHFTGFDGVWGSRTKLRTMLFDSIKGLGVGWLSNDNPQETLHKIRWGHPGTGMPSMVTRD